jgi:prepilin-type N-terminal cleavage/methylation domain-containing protein
MVSFPSFNPRKARGFTLLETLACVLVIGILAAVAIGWYAGHRDVVVKVSRQRNAQEIVNMAVCATVAGCDFVVPGDKFNTIQNLITGTYGTTGIYKGKLFRLTSLELDQLAASLPFVKMEDGLILYDFTGSQPL